MLPIIGKSTINPAPSNGLFTYGQISIILKKTNHRYNKFFKRHVFNKSY